MPRKAWDSNEMKGENDKRETNNETQKRITNV